MGNKVKYNLKNVHAAKLTETVVEGVTSYSYATPQAIPGAVSISLDAEGDSSPFYADGIVYFRSYANNGYSGDLEIALIPEWFRTEILKETLDTNGVLVPIISLLFKGFLPFDRLPLPLLFQPLSFIIRTESVPKESPIHERHNRPAVRQAHRPLSYRQKARLFI